MDFFEILKVIALGIVEGITEWLPISSTGHLLLFNAFFNLNATKEFFDVFLYFIQLGAILAVVILFWKKMWPFQFKDKTEPIVRKDVFSTWFKVVVACIPGFIATVLFDDIIEAHLSTPVVISIALIVYGILFILVETYNAKRQPKTQTLGEITYLTALYIGLFQVLSIIPGTSRSGATIIGALIIGVSRVAAAEFTFFLAVPVMIGMSLLKIVKYVLEVGFFATNELIILGIGFLVAFVVSLFVIKFLMNYIKKKDFKPFGWYRIILGVIIIVLAIANVI